MNFYRFQFSPKIIHLFNYLGTSSVLVILPIATLKSLSDKCNLSILYGFIVGFIFPPLRFWLFGPVLWHAL